MALVVLHLPCVAPVGQRGRGYRRRQYDWPKKSTDFGGEPKGVASVWSSEGFRVGEVELITLDRYGRMVTLIYFVMVGIELGRAVP